ncbi:MAG: GAF domain-containing protein [Thermoleophilia bacterium]
MLGVDLTTGEIVWDWRTPPPGMPEAADERPSTLAEALELVHPDDRELVVDAVEAAAEADGPYDFTFRPALPDGGVRWVRWSGRRLVDEQGRPRLVGVQHDVTAQREAEEALRAAERRAEALLANLPEAVFRMRRDGTYLEVHASAEDVLLVPREELVGRTIQELLPDLAPLRLAMIDRALATGEPQVAEFEAVVRGHALARESRVVPVGDDEVLVVVRDVGERRRNETALARRDAILAGVGSAATRLLTDSAFDDAIDEALAILGVATGVDRVLLAVEPPQAGTAPTIRSVWLAPGAKAERRAELPVALPGLAGAQGQLRAGRPFVNAGGALTPEELRLLGLPAEARSVVVPVEAHGRLWGGIGFDDLSGTREWSQAEVEALAIAARIVGAAIERSDADEALRASEERHRLVVQHMPDLLLRYSSEAVFLEHLAGDRTASVPLHESLGKHVAAILPGDIGTLYDEAIRSTAATGAPRTVEYDIEIDGRVRRREGRTVRLADGDVLVLVRDITKRHAAQGALRHREAILLALSRFGERLLLSNPGDWGAFEPGLAALGEGTRAASVCLTEHEHTAQGLGVRVRAVWRTPDDVEAGAPWVDGIVEGPGLEPWLRPLQSGVPVTCVVGELPPHARAVFRWDDASLLVVPVLVDDRLWGTITLVERQERTWTEIEAGALAAAGRMLGATLDRQRAAEALQRRDAVLAAIGRFATGVLGERVARADAVQILLESLLDATGSCRASLFQCERADDDWIARPRAEANAPHLDAAPAAAYGFRERGMGEDLERLTRGETIVASLTDATPGLRARLLTRRLGSVILTPIQVEGLLWGHLGIADENARRQWTAVELDALRMAGTILAAAIEQERSTLALTRAERIFDAVRRGADLLLRATPGFVDLQSLARLLGEAADVDVSSIYEAGTTASGERYTKRSHTWTRDGQPMAEQARWEDGGRTTWRGGGFGRWEELLLADRAVAGLARDFPPEERALLDVVGARSVAAAPIVVRGELWGSIGFYVRTEERAFGAGEIDALRAAADIAGAAIERALVNAALASSNARLERIVARLIAAKEHERQRIAGEIHDDSIQGMTAVGLRLQLLRRKLVDPDLIADVERLEQTVSETIGRMRRLLFELRPPELEQAGLVGAVRSFAAQTFDGTATEVTVTGPGSEPPLAIAALAYRVVREAVVNARKHAGAAHLEVAIDRTGDELRCRVVDDGAGFVPDTAAEVGHMGIYSMRALVEDVGGTIEIDAARAVGTRVEVRLPLLAPPEGDLT